MSLTLADFTGLLREVEWPRRLNRTDFPAGAKFAGYFYRSPSNSNDPEHDCGMMQVIGAPGVTGSQDQYRYCWFLQQQFPSLTPVTAFGMGVWRMSLLDFAKMRLLFGGKGWT